MWQENLQRGFISPKYGRIVGMLIIFSGTDCVRDVEMLVNLVYNRLIKHKAEVH